MKYSIEPGDKVLKVTFFPDDVEWKHIAKNYRVYILRTENYKIPRRYSGLLDKLPTADLCYEAFRSLATNPMLARFAYDEVKHQLFSGIREVEGGIVDEISKKLRNGEKPLEISSDLFIRNNAPLYRKRQTENGMLEAMNLIDELYTKNKIVLEFTPQDGFPGLTVDFRTNPVTIH